MMPLSVRRHLVDWVLLITAVVLVGVVLATGASVTTSERESRSFNVLAAFREDEITRVVVERGEERLQLERREAEGEEGSSTWYVTEPFEEEAEPFSVEKLLGTLQFASWVRSIKPEEVDRAGFGLDAPRMVVHVDMGEIRYRLRLGKEAASPPGSAYLEVTGEGAPRKGIVIIPGSLITELDVDADDFRGRYVMPYLSPALAGIELDGAGGRRKLRRTEWNTWAFDGMQNGLRVDRQTFDLVLLQFARTEAQRFVEPARAREAIDGEDAVRITMIPSDDGKPKGRVSVGGACPGDAEAVVGFRHEPDELAACVPKSVMAGLTLPAEALIDRSLFWLRKDEIEGITIVQGERTLVLDRKGEGFILREPREAEVDPEAGDARLEALAAARGRLVESPDLTALGLDRPHGRVTLRSVAAHEKEVVEETVRISAPDGEGRVYALREQDGAVIELHRDAARALRADASLVRSRSIFDFPLSEVRAVEIEGPVRQRVTRSREGSIALEHPDGFDADGALCMELLDTLRTLTADRWVADEDDGSFGLDKPVAAARLSIQKGEEEVRERKIRLGWQTDGGHYAAVDGEPGVFVAPRRVHEVLTTLALDRALFMMDPEEVTSISLVTPERRVVLERHGAQFIQTSGDIDLSPASIRRLVDALTVARAEAAIALGEAPPAAGLQRPLLTVRIEREAGRGARSAPRIWRVGAGDSWRGMSVHYARVEGVKATYMLPRSTVRQLLEPL